MLAEEQLCGGYVRYLPVTKIDGEMKRRALERFVEYRNRGVIRECGFADDIWNMTDELSRHQIDYERQTTSAEAVAKNRKLEKENVYLRKMLRTYLYPNLANELLREMHVPVPENTSVRPEAMAELIDGRFPSAFEGTQAAPEKKPDWKDQLQSALEMQVDSHGK